MDTKPTLARSLRTPMLPVIGLIGTCLAAPLLHAQQNPSQQEPTPPPPVSTPWARPSDGKGIQFQAGDYILTLGGYVKVDLIHDFDAIGSTDNFDPRTIPTDGTDGSNTRMHARQTRLNLDLRGPTSSGDMRIFVEGDFFGSGNSFRLRHAYAAMGGLLAGQTWSNFMDEDGMPETLDFESPIGFPQIRQAQVRYTSKFENGDSLAFSIEDPASVIVEPTTVTGHTEEILPDATAHYIWKTSKAGHVQLSGFGGMSSYNPDVGSGDSVPLWGANLSTKIPTWGEDSTILQVTYGDGVGRYRGGITAAPNSNGSLEAITTTAALASYEHHWNATHRSTIMYSWAEGDLPAGTPLTASQKLQYFAANFIWQFSDHAWAGVEYLYGTNGTFDGNEGVDNRLQMSIRFNL